MEFLKKHYEKIILGIVLIGLAAAVAALPFFISSEKQKLNQLTTEATKPHPKPLTNLDLTVTEKALQRVAAPALIDFGPPNRLFNPMPWQKAPDGHLVPIDKVGPTRLVVTNIAPLYLTIKLDSVKESDGGPRYVIGVEDESAAALAQRSKRQYYLGVKASTKSDPVTIVAVQGKPEDPTALTLELRDTGERVTLPKERPYRRVEGYMADLFYDLGPKTWTKRRVNSQPPLTFNGEEYNIVAINQNEVVLSAKSNGKKWTIKASSNAAPKPN